MAIYISELRALAEFCNFTNLEEMLRDRLVCGINHDRTQNRLLSEPKLTYEKALEIAQSQETAAQNLRELKNNPQPAKDEASFGDMQARDESGGRWQEVHLFQVRPRRASGQQMHDCHECGKKGHLASVCKSRPKGKPKKHAKKVHQVEKRTTRKMRKTTRCFP